VKILIYPVVEVEFKELQKLIEPLEGEGFELFFATPNKNLIPLMSISKIVVVNPKTIDYDFAITMQQEYKPQGKYVVYNEKNELSDLYEKIENLFT